MLFDICLIVSLAFASSVLITGADKNKFADGNSVSMCNFRRSNSFNITSEFLFGASFVPTANVKILKTTPNLSDQLVETRYH